MESLCLQEKYKKKLNSYSEWRAKGPAGLEKSQHHRAGANQFLRIDHTHFSLLHWLLKVILFPLFKSVHLVITHLLRSISSTTLLLLVNFPLYQVWQLFHRPAIAWPLSHMFTNRIPPNTLIFLSVYKLISFEHTLLLFFSEFLQDSKELWSKSPNSCMISVPLVAHYCPADLHCLNIFINCKWEGQKQREIVVQAKIYTNTQV